MNNALIITALCLTLTGCTRTQLDSLVALGPNLGWVQPTPNIEEVMKWSNE